MRRAVFKTIFYFAAMVMAFSWLFLVTGAVEWWRAAVGIALTWHVMSIAAAQLDKDKS